MRRAGRSGLTLTALLAGAGLLLTPAWAHAKARARSPCDCDATQPWVLTTGQPDAVQLLTQGGSIVQAQPLLNGSAALNPALLQLVWHVNAVSGDDGNDGKTLLTPVKTIMGGIVPKWGSNRVILGNGVAAGSQFQIFIDVSQPAGLESIVLDVTTVGLGTSFGIYGSYAQGAGGNLAAVTPKNRNTPQLLTVNLGAAAAQRVLVHNTTRNSRAWVSSLVPLAGAVATMNQPLVLNALGVAPGSVTAVEDDTWANGDAFVIETVPAINLVELVYRSSQFNGTASPPTSGCVLQALNFIAGAGGATFMGPHLMTIGSQAQIVVLDCLNDTNGARYDGTPNFASSSINELCSVNFFLNASGWFFSGGEHGRVSCGNLVSFDRDAIVDRVDIGAGTSFLLVYFRSFIRGGAGIGQSNPGYGYFPGGPAASIIWGPAVTHMQAGATITGNSTTTWTASWKVTGTMFLDSATTGYSVNGTTGAVTGSITITPANIDANNGNIQRSTHAGYLTFA